MPLIVDLVLLLSPDNCRAATGPFGGLGDRQERRVRVVFGVENLWGSLLVQAGLDQSSVVVHRPKLAEWGQEDRIGEIRSSRAGQDECF